MVATGDGSSTRKGGVKETGCAFPKGNQSHRFPVFMIMSLAKRLKESYVSNPSAGIAAMECVVSCDKLMLCVLGVRLRRMQR